MKKSLIALAIAATAAAPMAASAASHGASGATVYGSFRADLVSNGGDLDISDGGSRYGVKGSHDLGNGLTGVYRIELKAKTDTANFPEGGRLSYVGIAGGFGTVALGQQWTPYYNVVAASSDVMAGGFTSFYSGVYRTGNALAYVFPGGSPISGAVALVIDGDSADEDDVDAVNAGFSFAAGPMTIGLGIHDAAAAADTLVGLSIAGKVGDVGLVLMAEDNGTTTPMTLTAKMGGFAIQFSDDDADDNSVAVRYTHKLGKKAKIQFSAKDQDSASDAKVVARLRVDI